LFDSAAGFCQRAHDERVSAVVLGEIAANRGANWERYVVQCMSGNF